MYATSLAGLRERLPSGAPEIAWHAALLTGGACVDGVLGGHTLDQGSAYSFRHGFNGAARDPLQHALPLVYLEPDLALSVLRNTCAWGSPDGDLPYALDGRKQPWTQLFRPSDQNLWALWLAAEYAAATGDIAAFAEPVPYHPRHGRSGAARARTCGGSSGSSSTRSGWASTGTCASSTPTGTTSPSASPEWTAS